MTVVNGWRASDDKSAELFPEQFPYGAGRMAGLRVVAGQVDREMIEGPRWRVMVSPGTVSIRYQDPVRRDRAHERAVRAAASPVNDDHAARGGACVTKWSARSRSRMVETLAQLDWAPMFTGSEVPAMVTLTYPDRWLEVVPDSEASRRHVGLLRKRFARAWGRKLLGVWKREFQRRGAPHWHILMVPPHGEVNGQNFRTWLSATWASIVDAERCPAGEHVDPDCRVGGCCEYVRHVAAGTGIDYADGVRANDPASVGVYFAKHGSFAEKEYQNHAPAEWVEQGTVGRFWGVWGLDKAVAGAFVDGDDALRIARTMRRYSRANAYVTRVPMWRYRTVVDPDTGEASAKWRKGSQLRRVYRVKHGSGFLVVKDGPALASSLARVVGREDDRRLITGSGAGPKGFLP